MKAELETKKKRDDDQMKRLMAEYPEDWLFHYYELMTKEQKHASKKLSNQNQQGNKQPGILFQP